MATKTLSTPYPIYIKDQENRPPWLEQFFALVSMKRFVVERTANTRPTSFALHKVRNVYPGLHKDDYVLLREFLTLHNAYITKDSAYIIFTKSEDYTFFLLTIDNAIHNFVESYRDPEFSC